MKVITVLQMILGSLLAFISWVLAGVKAHNLPTRIPNTDGSILVDARPRMRVSNLFY